nr:tripartite tricarboxylate transporter substrate-binding protein [uncultured Actinotalea sp.]
MRTTRSRGRALVGVLAVTTAMVLAACGSDSAGGDDAADETPEPGASETAEEVDPAEEAAAFLDGKTIKIIVPYNPGGGFDNFVRLLAPELEKELDGVRIQVENQPGGGGLIGANAIYQAEPDGLTIGLINYPGAVFAEATGQEGVVLENANWTHLGRLGAIPPVVYTGADTGLATMEDVINATEPVVFGIGGVGSDAYYATVVLSEVLGFPNEIIGGYPGSGEADAALTVGEVDASVNSRDAALATIEGSGAIPVVYISTQESDRLPSDVPLITEFGEGDDQSVLEALASIYDLERIMVGPPGMDEAIADYIADAIFRAASGDGYITAMEDAGYVADALARDDVIALAETGSAAIEVLAPLVAE